MESVARNFALGIEISETALNKVSAVLYKKKPELFEISEDILVEPSTQRRLGLYAFMDEPFAFNMHPIQGSDLKEGSLYVEAALTFALTDKQADEDTGTVITRIKMRLLAGLEVQGDVSVDNQSIQVFLKDLDFKDFQGDHPEGLLLAMPHSTKDIVRDSAENLPSKDPSFIALLNYLIDVFLKKTLAKPLEEFPFPPLNVVSGTNVNLYMRATTTWGNSLGAYLSLGAGPAISIQGKEPTQQADLSMGLTEGVITAALNATLPMTLPIDPTPDNRTFSIRGGSFIRMREDFGPFRSNLDMRSPDKVRATLFFDGHINGQINVKLGKYWVRVGVPLPIGAGSSISGAFNHLIKQESDRFELWFRAAPDIFRDMGLITVITEYQELMSNAVRDWLRNNVSPVLRSIPIIGWIISKGVEVIVGELLTYFVGKILDGVVSTFLTTILTTLYNVIRLGWNDKLEFRAAEIKKLAFGDKTPIELQSLRVPGIVGNQGGELILLGDLDKPLADIPEPPIPKEPKVEFEEFNARPPTVSITPPGKFLPAVPLHLPFWEAGTTDLYKLRLTLKDQVFSGTQEVIVNETGDGSCLQLKISIQTGATAQSETDIVVRVSKADGRILSEEQTLTAEGPNGSMPIFTKVNYNYLDGVAESAITFGDLPPVKQVIDLPDGATVVSSAQSIFQLQLALVANTTGKLARLNFDEETNLGYFVPVEVSVGGIITETIHGVPTEIYSVDMRDAEHETQIKMRVAAPHELFKITQKGAGLALEMILQ